MMVEKIKSIRYWLWVARCWLSKIMLPSLRELSISARKKLMLVGVAIVLSLPINYYLFFPPNDMQVNAAENNAPIEQEKVTAPVLLSELNPEKQAEKPLQTTESDSNKINNVVESSNQPLVLPLQAVAKAQLKAPQQETAVEHAKKHMDPQFVCPMHSEIVTSDPNATCPLCGMDLVALDLDGDADIVKLAPNVINALGVRVSPVKKRTLYRRIHSVGYIAYDESRIRTVSLRTEGWVEHLVVKSVGDRVKKGDLLFEVYSPTLVNAQEEYVQALQFDGGDGLMIMASRQRLKVLGVSDQQIETLQEMQDVKELVSIFSPQNGVITELNIREGMFVVPSKNVISLADLSSVWLLIDVFESQVNWLKTGQKAEASLAFSPDKKWQGTVEYVYPSLDPKTRSIKARLRFDNFDELLKPNMYADVTIFAQPKKKVLVIPREALIHTAEHQRVIVALGEGRFQPRIVRTGLRTEGRVEVLAGLDVGESVVISSQFLIDSESSMRASLLRMVGTAN